MQLALSESVGGHGRAELHTDKHREFLKGEKPDVSNEHIVQGLLKAFAFYRNRAKGTIDFENYWDTRPPDGAFVDPSSTAVKVVKYKNRPAAVMQIIALGMHEGTGSSGYPHPAFDPIEYLASDEHRRTELMHPVDKSMIHTEAYVPLLKIDVRKRRGTKITELHGGVDLLGFVSSDHSPRSIGKIATVQSNLATLHNGPTPHVVATTSWVDLQGGWNDAPESTRFAGASAYYNKYGSLQIFGLLQVYDPDNLNILRRLNTLNPKDRNPNNLDF